MKSTIILSFLLAGSLLGNGLAYSYLRHCYDKHAIMRLDPLGEVDESKHHFENKFYDTVILGDSIAGQWDIKNALNLGIGSQTSTQIRIRSSQCKDALEGGTLIVCIGGNDYISLPTRLSEKDYWVGQFRRNLKTIIANHEPHFKTIVISTLTPLFYAPNRYKLIYNQGMIDAQLEMNEIVREFASDRVLVLDAYKILTNQPSTKPLTTDGVHLTSHGYQLLNEELDRLLQSARVKTEE